MRWLNFVLLCILLSAPIHVSATEVSDPLEPINRFFTAFNQDVLDRFVLKPVAHTYKTIVPRELRAGVVNVVSNIKEPGYAINHLLVGEWQQSLTSVARFGINSTVGIFGLFDVAQGAKIYRDKKKFFQVLGHYGVGNGPYLMLPFIGPSTPRNFLGSVVDTLYFPFSEMSSDHRLIYTGSDILNQRVDFIPQEHILKNAPDPYVVIRNIYWQSVQVKTDSEKQASFQETIPEEFLEELE